MAKTSVQQEYNAVPLSGTKYPRLDVYICISLSLYGATDKTLSWSRGNPGFPKIDNEATAVYFYILMCRLISDSSAPVNDGKHEILGF